MFQPIAPLDLTYVVGGGAPDPSFGRCGPGAEMPYLGDVRTPACARHDALVDRYLAGGSSTIMAHLRAAPALPAAVGSYVGVRAGQLADQLGRYLK